jgi:hypothetical protein
VLLTQKRFAEGQSLLQKAVDGNAKAFGDAHLRTAIVRRQHGRALAGLQRFAEAETELLAAERVIAGAANASADRKLGAAKALVALYEAWNATAPTAERAASCATWPSVDAAGSVEAVYQPGFLAALESGAGMDPWTCWLADSSLPTASVPYAGSAPVLLVTAAGDTLVPEQGALAAIPAATSPVVLLADSATLATPTPTVRELVGQRFVVARGARRRRRLVAGRQRLDDQRLGHRLERPGPGRGFLRLHHGEGRRPLALGHRRGERLGRQVRRELRARPG